MNSEDEALARRLLREITEFPWEDLFVGGPINPKKIDIYEIHQALTGMPVAQVGNDPHSAGWMPTHSGKAQDAEFIAKAPELLQAAMDEIDQLRKELAFFKLVAGR